MATIIKFNGGFRVGRDFVDATTNMAVASRGELKTSLTNDKVHTWESTLSIADTEHAFRAATQTDGCRITYFMSQAVE